MQISNGSDEYCWRYRADTILPQTDRRTSLENLISAAMKQAAPHTCGRTDGQGETSIPSFQLRWSGGIINNEHTVLSVWNYSSQDYQGDFYFLFFYFLSTIAYNHLHHPTHFTSLSQNWVHVVHTGYFILINGKSYRADSMFAPSQWEMALLCNDVSHWLGSSLESALIIRIISTKIFILGLDLYWLTQLPLVPHIGISEFGQHWFR